MSVPMSLIQMPRKVENYSKLFLLETTAGRGALAYDYFCRLANDDLPFSIPAEIVYYTLAGEVVDRDEVISYINRRFPNSSVRFVEISE
jgi:hypothetical protein